MSIATVLTAPPLRQGAQPANFARALRHGPLLLDGAMGTMLEAAVRRSEQPIAPTLDYLVPEQLNVLAPQVVLDVHRAYVAAGAQILETNSFGGNGIKLGAAGLTVEDWRLNFRAAQLAREAAVETARPIWVAGSIGPTGQFLSPGGDLSFGEAREAFAEQAAALAAGGVDFLLIETMTDLEEARAAVLGASEGSGLPVAVTFSFEGHGRTMMGVTPEAAAALAAELGAVAAGANCGDGPAAMLPILRRMHAAVPDLVLVAQPNAGQPRLAGQLDGQDVAYDVDPTAFAALAPSLLGAGVHLLGTCCGSTPAHTAALAALLATIRRGN